MPARPALALRVHLCSRSGAIDVWLRFQQGAQFRTARAIVLR